MINEHPPHSRGLIERLLVAFVLLTCLKIWIFPLGGEKTAQAQLPDPGSQRLLMVDEQRKTNQLLAEISRKMDGQTFKVRIEGDDKKPGPKVYPRAGGNTPGDGTG